MSEGAIGLGTGISNVAEFNRRAAIALRGVDFRGDAGARGMHAGLEKLVLSKQAPALGAQQSIYNLVHRYRRQINDRLVVDFAADRARGAD